MKNDRRDMEEKLKRSNRSSARDRPSSSVSSIILSCALFVPCNIFLLLIRYLLTVSFVNNSYQRYPSSVCSR